MPNRLTKGKGLFGAINVPAGGLFIADTAVTSTAAELNALDGITASVAELNIMDGVTATAAELNILDGVTSTAAELNILDGVTATAAELNILDGVTSTFTELNILDGVTATAVEINRAADVSTRVVNGTAAGTLSITEATHDGKLVLLNRAAGFDVALPAATGSGAKLHFIVATTGTANYVITAAGNDTMFGNAWFVTDNAGTVIAFKAGGGSIITLNGSTTAGIKGDSVELFDIATDTWWVNVLAAGTGSEATPFS